MDCTETCIIDCESICGCPCHIRGKLPDLSADTHTAHMLRWIMKRKVTASDEFTQELERHRRNGKWGPAMYGRWSMFHKYTFGRRECTCPLIIRTENPNRARGRS